MGAGAGPARTDRGPGVSGEPQRRSPGPGDSRAGSRTRAQRPGLEPPRLLSKNRPPGLPQPGLPAPPPSGREGAGVARAGGAGGGLLGFPKPYALFSPGSSSLGPCRAGQFARPPRRSEPCLQTWIMKSKRINCEYFVPQVPKVQAPRVPGSPYFPGARNRASPRTGACAGAEWTLPFQGLSIPGGRGLLDMSFQLGPGGSYCRRGGLPGEQSRGSTGSGGFAEGRAGEPGGKDEKE